MVNQDHERLAELRRNAESATQDADRAASNARLAIGLRRAGRYIEALPAARTAAALFGRLEMKKPAAITGLLLGELLFTLDIDHEAAHRLAEARHALELTGASPRLIIRSERLLADVARHRDRLDEAERWLCSARDRCKQVGMDHAAARCEHDLGVLFHGVGEVHRSIATLRSARSLLLDVRDREGVASCLFNLGVALQDGGEDEEAVDHYQQARSIFAAVARHDDAAACDQNIAAVFFASGRVEDAGQRLMAAQATYRELGMARQVAECDAGLAEVLRATGRDEAATAYLARARSEGVDSVDHAPATA